MKKKNKSARDIFEIVFATLLLITGFFIFYEVVTMVPLVVALAALKSYEGGNNGLILAFPAFVKTWFVIIVTFGVSMVGFLITKDIKKRKSK